MSLRTLLNRATYDAKAEDEPGGAEVIPLRAFDPVACSDRIKELARQKAKADERLAETERNYTETIAIQQGDCDAIDKKLADERKALKDWCDHHMEADDE